MLTTSYFSHSITLQIVNEASVLYFSTWLFKLIIFNTTQKGNVKFDVPECRMHQQYQSQLPSPHPSTPVRTSVEPSRSCPVPDLWPWPCLDLPSHMVCIHKLLVWSCPVQIHSKVSVSSRMWLADNMWWLHLFPAPLYSQNPLLLQHSCYHLQSAHCTRITNAK